jgi:hypothetical protein
MAGIDCIFIPATKTHCNDDHRRPVYFRCKGFIHCMLNSARNICFAMNGITRHPATLTVTTHPESSSNGCQRFEEIILPHLGDALTLTRWLTRNDQDACDVMQESFLRAFRFFGSYRMAIRDHGCWRSCATRTERGSDGKRRPAGRSFLSTTRPVTQRWANLWVANS